LEYLDFSSPTKISFNPYAIPPIRSEVPIEPLDPKKGITYECREEIPDWLSFKIQDAMYQTVSNVEGKVAINMNGA